MRGKTEIKLIALKSGVLVIALALFLLPINASIAFAASLSTLQQQQAAAAAAAAAAQQKAAAAAAQATAINTQIANLNQQINDAEAAITSTQNDINSTQSAIDSLVTQIAAKQDELKSEQDKMNKIISSWYMEGDNSGLTYALLSSGTLSDAITKQQYYESIKQQIQATMDKINTLKSDLEKQKADQDAKIISLKNLKDQKQNYYNSQLAQKNTKNRLLTGTLADKQAYLNQADSLAAEAHRLSDEIYALRVQLEGRNGETINSGGGGGYPYSEIDVPDPWMFLTRECTSYAAWYWNIIEGKRFINTRPGEGSAYNWPALAADQGYSVSNTARVGAIISWGQSASMPYGHVAIVQGVNGNGTIDVSEYNWVRYSYDLRSNVNPGAYGSYHYIY